MADVKKVLIVEDDKAFANALKTECELSGLEVLWAEDAGEALKMAEEQQPDLIFLDIIIPERTGLTVLKELKQNEKTKSIPVIGLSNFGGPENEKKVLSLGATAFFKKGELNLPQLVSQAMILPSLGSS